MSVLRVLHVDDEPDIRAVVEIALGLDPEVSLRGCGSGAEALIAAADRVPDLILLDVMMPNMDGPTTLAHLRESPKTANIPVVFMTARAQARELEHFLSLGAAGVIAKPFDPMKLAAEVRRFSQTGRIEKMRLAFVQRARKDAASLASCRRALGTARTASGTLAEIRTVAHGLAGVAGIYGFAVISEAAADLEHHVIAEVERGGGHEQVGGLLDDLLTLLDALRDPASEAVFH
jgi:two-component system OmpR family response regulator